MAEAELILTDEEVKKVLVNLPLICNIYSLILQVLLLENKHERTRIILCDTKVLYQVFKVFSLGSEWGSFLDVKLKL